MKIVDAKVIVCCPGRNFVTVKITTEDGVHGLGDATLNGRELFERSCSSTARWARCSPHRGYLAIFLQGSVLAARACDDERDRGRGHRTLGHQSEEPERSALPAPWRRFSRGRAGLRSRQRRRH